ncbi:pyridoxamine 5'-phosphate oxidase family protein [Dysgonomonas sp. 216]|uniref:pyridoxamine 5'-phosphate oxidase family protein n=1 Tax=Dysgonomonas sp. 216 TaxID=2302934 RepID=UPI0013D6E331|nr:pyridoxamine 5'-phosphate oxidase family protein [Dysgonomonas sp. 216]NDW17588.1 pyridoxamine 5'-phosphate oxidase family protein [Dysgonomonas sp. 216]
MFREIRRKNRELTGERIYELLETSEYGFLSLGVSDNGYAYGVPMSYVYDKDANFLYFHCASDGQKLDEIKRNSKVSFCVVGKTQPVADKFTTLYESVIAFGEAVIIESDEEKRKALRLLVKKYSNGFEDLGETYMAKSWDRTTAFKILVQHVTAKAKY